MSSIFFEQKEKSLRGRGKTREGGSGFTRHSKYARLFCVMGKFTYLEIVTNHVQEIRSYLNILCEVREETTYLTTPYYAFLLSYLVLLQ